VEGNAYILSQVVHNWPDPDAVRILRNCRAAMRDSGRLLVVERALGPDPKTALGVLHTDMSMLVHLGGLERTAAEYRALFAEAGFQLANVVPFGDRSPFSVFEGVPIGLGAIQAS
jgi:O-methyltransferase domain